MPICQYICDPELIFIANKKEVYFYIDKIWKIVNGYHVIIERYR